MKKSTATHPDVLIQIKIKKKQKENWKTKSERREKSSSCRENLNDFQLKFIAVCVYFKIMSDSMPKRKCNEPMAIAYNKQYIN